MEIARHTHARHAKDASRQRTRMLTLLKMVALLNVSLPIASLPCASLMPKRDLVLCFICMLVGTVPLLHQVGLSTMSAVVSGSRQLVCNLCCIGLLCIGWTMLAVCAWSDRAAAQVEADRADLVAQTAAAWPRPGNEHAAIAMADGYATWIGTRMATMPRRVLTLRNVSLPKLDLVAICLMPVGICLMLVVGIVPMLHLAGSSTKSAVHEWRKALIAFCIGAWLVLAVCVWSDVADRAATQVEAERIAAARRDRDREEAAAKAAAAARTAERKSRLRVAVLAEARRKVRQVQRELAIQNYREVLARVFENQAEAARVETSGAHWRAAAVKTARELLDGAAGKTKPVAPTPMLATCVVCFDDQKPCTAFSGCGHVVACADCAARIVGDNPSGEGRCPVCRVVSIPLSLYFS